MSNFLVISFDVHEEKVGAIEPLPAEYSAEFVESEGTHVLAGVAQLAISVLLIFP